MKSNKNIVLLIALRIFLGTLCIASSISFVRQSILSVGFLTNSNSISAEVLGVNIYSYDDGQSYELKLGYKVDNRSEETLITTRDEHMTSQSSVLIRYLRKQPQEIRFDSFWSLYGRAIQEGILSLLFLALLILTYVKKDWILKQRGGHWPYG